jgi:6,7-dimethyl-8-ribityllumazine synthase
MSKRLEGNLVVAPEHKFALVISRFNEFFTSKLVGGAIDALKRHGARDDQIWEVWVPGAFEIPVVASKLAKSGRYSAVVCLGCVIRGHTPHFEYVASQAARGIAQASLQTGVPVIFGVVTADNLEQAIERAGSKAGNRGADAAMIAIEMVNLLQAVDGAGA